MASNMTFMWAMMAALLSSALWVNLATWLGAPVSTTVTPGTMDTTSGMVADAGGSVYVSGATYELIFDLQYEFIQNNGVLLAMVGMLGAIPTTPLYTRLEAEGRLVEGDPNCNFHPKQMSREELISNYWDLVERLYRPEAFLERYLHSYRLPEYHARRAAMCDKAKEGKFLPTLGYAGILLKNLTWTLLRDGSFKKLAPTYLRYYRKSRKYRRDLIGLAQFLNRCVTHFHFYRFTREARSGQLRTYNSG